VVHGLARELRLTLGDEQPGKIVLAGGEIPLDGSQLVAGDRLLLDAGIGWTACWSQSSQSSMTNAS
jgi:hypothetical protein